MTERAVPERGGSGHGLSVGGYVRVAVFLIVALAAPSSVRVLT